MEYPRILLDNNEVDELRGLAQRMYKGADRANEIINSFERQLNMLGMKIPVLCNAPFYGVYFLMWNKHHDAAASGGGELKFKLFVTQTQVSIFDLGRGEIRPSLLASAPIELQIAAVPHLPEIVAILKQDMLQAVNVAEGATKSGEEKGSSKVTPLHPSHAGHAPAGYDAVPEEAHRGHGCPADPELTERGNDKDPDGDDDDGDNNGGDLH